MNERIQELLVQSGLLINVSEHRVNELDPNIKKFAELLVVECLLAISKTDVSLEEVSVMIKCHDQVEKYFGIES